MEYRGQRYTFDADARLGSGGMAEVYLGVRRDAPQKHVALKIPLPGLHPELRDLFLREAQAAQKVSGPNVVEVVDWGAEPPFIAFEFIEGPTLERVLVARRGDGRYWPEAELIEMYQQLVDAMASINQEVIHRDLKPANIFVAKGLLKVADFGISKYVGEGTRTKTFKGWGTAPYMAPETWRGLSLDWRADQYSLGVVFYEMATFELPFTGSDEELERKHLFERPRRVTALASSLSERLATMIA